MSYVLDEKSYNSPNYTPAADVPSVFLRPRTLNSITCHWWGAYGQAQSGVSEYLSRPMGNSSAHEVIAAGRVNVLIAHANAAWHAGNPVGNATSIGLELHPEATDADYQTAGERIRDIRAMHGIDLPLVRHSSWIQTACPGTYDLARLDKIARATAPAKPPAKPPVVPPKPSKIVPPGRYWIVDPGDNLSKIAGFYGITIQSILALPFNAILRKNPNILVPGQFVDIPEAGGYQKVPGCIVESGDTLSGIAQQFKVDLNALIRLNGLAKPYTIYPGQYLRFP